ncbi:hypothetical protein PG997_010218 [Apiospora hydei]|uniref:PARP-type domain-containing protein n=1 Tax=Apiospora hydei TaxID=1337664 RepID=A0ABR1VWC6_9PEZI
MSGNQFLPPAQNTANTEENQFIPPAQTTANMGETNMGENQFISPAQINIAQNQFISPAQTTTNMGENQFIPPAQNTTNMAESQTISPAQLSLPSTPRQIFHQTLGPDDLFFVEVAPATDHRCSDRSCKKIAIVKNKIRIGRTGTTDFWHPTCFEKLVDFKDMADVCRFRPLTWTTHDKRGGLPEDEPVPHAYLDAGAERLVWEWMDWCRRTIQGNEQLGPLFGTEDHIQRTGFFTHPLLDPAEHQTMEDGTKRVIWHVYCQFGVLNPTDNPNSLSIMLAR